MLSIFRINLNPALDPDPDPVFLLYPKLEFLSYIYVMPYISGDIFKCSDLTELT